MTHLIQSFAQPRAQTRGPRREPQAVRAARGFIQEHFAERISLADLAQRAHLSRYHLLRVFRREVGMPPHTYQESLRIQHGQRLIAAGQPLAQVADQLGFSSQSHFTQRFKRHIGVTPGRYAHDIAH